MSPVTRQKTPAGVFPLPCNLSDLLQVSVRVHQVTGTDGDYVVQSRGMFLLRKGCKGVPKNTDTALWEDNQTARLLQHCETPAERGYNCSINRSRTKEAAENTREEWHDISSRTGIK